MIDPELLRIKKKKERNLLSIPGVVGVGVRNRRIMVYVENDKIVEEIPLEADGIPITAFVTGKIYPLNQVLRI